MKRSALLRQFRRHGCYLKREGRYLNWREKVERQDGYQPYEGEIDKERMSRGRL